MNRLPSPVYKELLDALLSAFPSYESLEQMVRFELDQNLAVIAGSGKLFDICYKLIDWAEYSGNIDKLLQGARKSNPGNPALIEFEENYGKLRHGKPAAQEYIPATSLKDILTKDSIQSISLILDFSTSPIGVKYPIGGRAIYLDSRLDTVKEEAENKTCGHLNIYFPIQDFNFTEALSTEDEIFVSGLVDYLANHSKIFKLSIEKFGAIPAVLKNFHHLEELRILECKNLRTLPWDIEYLTKLERLIIQETSIDIFPMPILKLSNLTHLDLSENQLRFIPPEICHLKKLLALSLLNNPLENLPHELNQLRSLRSLLVEDRLQRSSGVTVGGIDNHSVNVKEEAKNSDEPQFVQIAKWTFSSFPKIIGRLFFDLFGQHEPAENSTLILGYLLIIFLFSMAGLVFLALVLVVFGLMSPTTIVDILEKIWQFFSSGK